MTIRDPINDGVVKTSGVNTSPPCAREHPNEQRHFKAVWPADIWLTVLLEMGNYFEAAPFTWICADIHYGFDYRGPWPRYELGKPFRSLDAPPVVLYADPDVSTAMTDEEYAHDIYRVMVRILIDLGRRHRLNTELLRREMRRNPWPGDRTAFPGIFGTYTGKKGWGMVKRKETVPADLQLRVPASTQGSDIYDRRRWADTLGRALASAINPAAGFLESVELDPDAATALFTLVGEEPPTIISAARRILKDQGLLDRTSAQLRTCVGDPDPQPIDLQQPPPRQTPKPAAKPARRPAR